MGYSLWSISLIINETNLKWHLPLWGKYTWLNENICWIAEPSPGPGILNKWINFLDSVIFQVLQITIHFSLFDTLDLYGACVTNDPDEPILPTLKENANEDFDVKSCIAACRSSGNDGYPYAGLTKQSGSILCFCGDEPTDGFDDLYALPDKCPVRCHRKSLESCW